MREVKVLSDIDDTFYANWKDARYPKKTVYPGVLQFYAELDRGPGPVPGRAGDLTFVTARPGDRLGLVEDATIKALAERGQLTATVLAGSFTRLIGNRTIAEKKLENFLEYRRLYPEYDFVFVGDSGQGDIHFGQRMLELAPGVVRAVFIHDVVATPDLARRSSRPRAFTCSIRTSAPRSWPSSSASSAPRARRAWPRPRSRRSPRSRSRRSADQEARRLEMARDVARLNEALPPSRRIAQVAASAATKRSISGSLL